jgi:hypothetical protein
MEFLKNFVLATLAFGLCYVAWQKQSNRTPSMASVSGDAAVPESTNSSASHPVSSAAPAPQAPAAAPVAPTPQPPVKLEMPKTNANGFARLIWPTNLDPNSVVIVAPLNCPSLPSRKADALAQQLTNMGISNKRTDSFGLQSPNPRIDGLTQSQINALQAKMDAEIKLIDAMIKAASKPTIFIRGNMVMMQANPSVSQVVAEYRKKPSPKSSASK